MTLELSSSPGKLEIKTWFDNSIRIWTEHDEISISMDDFCAAMYYVITNTPIGPADPRNRFLKIAKELNFAAHSSMIGWPEDSKTLQYKGRDCFSLVYPGDFKDSI